MDKKYRINDKYVVRDDDMSVFSLENMEIYEFNKVGFETIKILEEYSPGGLTYIDFKLKCMHIPDFIEEDFDIYFKALIEKEIILPS